MSAATAGKGTQIRVRQVRSGIGYNEDQKRTLRALGLDRVGRSRDLPDNGAVRGMISKVSHLVEIEPTGAEGN